MPCVVYFLKSMIPDRYPSNTHWVSWKENLKGKIMLTFTFNNALKASRSAESKCPSHQLHLGQAFTSRTPHLLMRYPLHLISFSLLRSTHKILFCKSSFVRAVFMDISKAPSKYTTEISPSALHKH
jgi:hypothetical protein